MTTKTHDYRELNFKAGIEIHAQLTSNMKLFCHCPAALTQAKPQDIVQRKFRPVIGEMGLYDPAMLIEFKKDKTIFYEVFETVCTYELDETPPFPINPDALYDSIKLAKMLNCNIVEETNVCRKNYLDGSVPGGFQRTTLIGYNGYITFKTGSIGGNGEKRLPITWFYIEEDAARKNNILTKGKDVYFKLDRLGIPLVEIVTYHNLKTPLEVVHAARTLGMLIKSSGIVRKGLGALRQDINVSIEEGDRVELKGIQQLQLIPVAIDLEIQRQIGLLKIKKELEKRKVVPGDTPPRLRDITDVFKETKSNMVKLALERNEKIFLLSLEGFQGLLGFQLQPNKRFGTELSDRVQAFTDLKGIIHSDEDLGKYGFSPGEIAAIGKKILSKDSAFIIVIGAEEEAKRALTFVHDRVLDAFKGVPQETRRVNAEGISTFMRDLHGRSRLYPDTDLPPIVIDQEEVLKIEKNLPEPFWDRIERIRSTYGVSEKLAEDLVYDDKIEVFEALIARGAPMKTVITTLTQTLTALSRDEVNIHTIQDKHLLEIFEALDQKKIAKEAIPDILTMIGKNPKQNISAVIANLGGGMSQEDLELLVEELLDNSHQLILERGMDAQSPLMGLVMKQARGKIDGRVVSETLRRLLHERLKRINEVK
ncbi:MAG: Glu-tRNA(Gln) amidotransferase subunit GatE [Candidatus Heimdallarchaeota archaeon]